MIIDHYERSPWRGHDTSIMLPLLLPPHALACNQGALHQHQFHHHPCHDHHHPHLTKGHLAKTRILALDQQHTINKNHNMIRHQLAFARVLGLGLWSQASPITKFITIILLISPSTILPRHHWSWFSMVIISISIFTFMIILIISPSAILPRQGSLVLVLPFDSLRPPFDPQLTASSSSKPKLSVLHKQDTFLKRKTEMHKQTD